MLLHSAKVYDVYHDASTGYNGAILEMRLLLKVDATNSYYFSVHLLST